MPAPSGQVVGSYDSNSKFGMFKFLKDFLRKILVTGIKGLDRYATDLAAPVPPPISDPAPVVQIEQIEQTSDAKYLRMPLQIILPGLPTSLLSRVQHPKAATLTVSLPLEIILPQLSRGAVQISFGTLKRSVPEAFSADTECDDLPVHLPLPEVVSRINPVFIPRRKDQTEHVSRDDIADPFQRANPKATVSVVPPTPEPVHSDPVQAQPFFSPRLDLPPETHANGNSVSLPREAQAEEISAPQPVAALDESLFLSLNLQDVIGSWPEPLQMEVAHSNLAEPKVLLPVDLVGQGLKRGRLCFPWLTLRSWIRPALSTIESPHAATNVELPLRLVAPLFLATQSERNPIRAPADMEKDFPDVFLRPAKKSPDLRKRTPPEGKIVWKSPTQAGTLPRNPVANAPLVEQTVSAPLREMPASPPAPGEASIFDAGVDSAKLSTPHGVVFRCVQLEGVTGALIASSEGLLVAERLPKGSQPDTLAAFVPMIYRRMSQSIAELRMGELDNVLLNFENVSWQIFRRNEVFLAVTGIPGVPLPTSVVADIVASLP